MKYTLKPYQETAVDEVLQRLEQAQTTYNRDGQESSFSLTATTGAGKTVMAAAVIEALFYGSEKFDNEPDPGAVVIWFSDDPNLNDQSRTRLMEASDKLVSTDLVTIAPPFSRPQLEPGKVYFLNTQRLGKNSLLTRGHLVDSGDEALPGFESAQPDLQGWTIWETIADTITADGLTVYLILDEAHRGFTAKTAREKPTIVRRLVSGHAGYPPIPIVWGISATIERFRDAMEAADASHTRRALDMVTVDGYSVQESGLVKDTVVLEIPSEAGNFDSVLVRRAARTLRESTERWAKYARTQGEHAVVHPLLVVQTPNTPDPDDVGLALDTIFSEYPDLRGNAVRHVLGDHTVQKFGAWEVEWIEPQRVQDESDVRVLIAKDAISTGWDCPRAEVMVSFRPAKDHTHITQLLGRMVRNPLAQRVPGDEKLNSVECILPFFDRTTAGKVVRYLTGQTENVDDPQRKVVVSECELRPNPTIPEQVWSCWDALPSMTVPQRGAAPVKRLVSLALALSADGVRPGALTEVQQRMHAVLDECQHRHNDALAKAVSEVWTVRGQAIAGRVGGTELTYTDFAERADDRAIRVAFSDARKAFGGDVAGSYVNHVAGPDDEGGDDGLRDAYVLTSALAYVPAVRDAVDQAADRLAEEWFDAHGQAVKALADARQQEYLAIRELATSPVRVDLMRPRTRIEDYVEEVHDDGSRVMAPLVERHVMCDADGKFPVGTLDGWEREVVELELARGASVAWYRNPSNRAVDSLGVSYRDELGNWRSMHPDFVFFNEVDGRVRASIVDPHGHHLQDSLVKLQGLAHYAEEYGATYDRIWAVSKIGASMRILDLQVSAVRSAILTSQKPPIELYQLDFAIEYDR
ncbi:MAG TPA: DEAD/DEAH box helicase family protein [Nocardioidaceae bacterium]|nr:DEAD/DEAH box helicase family protein [Nocardioidaceae bacterium]